MYVREDFDQREYFGDMGSWVSSALKKIGLAKKKETKKAPTPATTAVAPTTAPTTPRQPIAAGFDFQKYQKYILPAAAVVGGLIVLKLVLKKKAAIQRGELL